MCILSVLGLEIPQFKNYHNLQFALKKGHPLQLKIVNSYKCLLVERIFLYELPN